MKHTTPDAPWYRQAFRDNYLKLYGHRDRTEARQAVDFLARVIHLNPHQRLLDLCCGAGRHLAYLERRVECAIGLDLSEVLLRTAQAQWDARSELEETCPVPLLDAAPIPFIPAMPRLVQGDMRRLPLADGAFDCVVNLFTSFGYFEADADNLAALREMARVLRPAGLLAIDHINRDYLLEHFQPRTVRPLADGHGPAAQCIHVIEERHWDEAAGRVTKEIILEDPDGGHRQWRERVRVWHPEEWPTLLAAAGLTLLGQYGNYDGVPFTPASPRLILIARRDT